MELSALQGKKVEWLPDFKQQHTYGSTYLAHWGSNLHRIHIQIFIIPLQFPEIFDRFSVLNKSKVHEFVGVRKPRIIKPGL